MNIYITSALLYLLVINTFENAYIFGICFVLILMLAEFIMSLFMKKVPSKYHMIISLVITGILVTVAELLLKEYIPDFYNEVGIYIPLIMLCLYSFNELKLKERLKVTFKRCIKYVGLLLVLVLFKELLSTGNITLMNNISYLTGYKETISISSNNFIPIASFDTFGSFLLVGLALGIINRLRRNKNA